MKYVLITGASTGIGFEAAKYLAQRGFSVFAGVRSDSDFERINSIDKNLKAIKIDITDEKSIDDSVVYMTNLVTQADSFALINNAGIVKAGPLEHIDINDLRKQLEVNVTSQVLVTQKFLPLLRESNEGRIIFTGSNSGVFTTPLNAPYAASKHAMEAIADGFRRELLGNSKITVSLLQPGQIKTPIWSKSLAVAKDARAAYPEDVEAKYGDLTKAIEKKVAFANDNAASTDVVSKAIYHALTSEEPKTRYYMGNSSFITQNLYKYLPDKLMDKILRKILKY
jgi:short-subunit dehydrogenase